MTHKITPAVENSSLRGYFIEIMKIVIAPDSFKHCLSAPEVAAALADGWRAARPGDELELVPLADGGEGFTAALTRALGGGFAASPAHDALGRPLTARYGVAGETRIVEMAAAAGIELLKNEERDALRASTYGFGEILRRLAGEGAGEIIAGIGSSATSDGGAGCAQALGWKLFDAFDRELPPGIGGGDLGRVARIERPPEAFPCRMTVACDVTSPLTGPEGAARRFSGQKGASAEEIEILERNLAHWGDLWVAQGLAAGYGRAGDGAAGGLGFFLGNGLRAEMVPGAELLFRAVDFEKRLAGAGLVITGEGRSDEQTGGGKLPLRVAELAARHGIPTVLVSGALDCGAGGLPGFAAAFSIASGPGTLEAALAAAPENLRRMGGNLARLVKCGEKTR